MLLLPYFLYHLSQDICLVTCERCSQYDPVSVMEPSTGLLLQLVKVALDAKYRYTLLFPQ